MEKFAVICPTWNDEDILAAWVKQWKHANVFIVLIIGRKDFNGKNLKNSEKYMSVCSKSLFEINEISPKNGIILECDDEEHVRRNKALEFLINEKPEIKYAFINDSDEFWTSVEEVKKEILEKEYDVYHARWWTYWSDRNHRIVPKEPYTPVVAINLDSDVEFSKIREVKNMRSQKVLMSELHHLSYARSPERIKEKIETWGHANEIVPNWYDEVFLKWNENKHMTNLHPTHPMAFKMAAKMPLPEELDELFE